MDNQKLIEVNDDEYNIEILPEDFGQYDMSFKIIAIGDNFVGKTCLMKKAVRNSFNEYYTGTIGFEFLTFHIRIKNEVVRLQIWDTCGQEYYKSLIINFYRNSSLALILYAINNKDTFTHAQNWLNELKEHALPNVKIFLIGNKSDLENERKVSKEEGENFKKDKKLDKFMETSAKTGDNARKTLIEVAKLLYKDYKKMEKKLGLDKQDNPQRNIEPGIIRINNGQHNQNDELEEYLVNPEPNVGRRSKCCIK